MKKFAFLIFAALMTSLSAFSQITVTGVGSSAKSSSQKSERKASPGGSTPENYQKIDDGAYECLYLYTVTATDKADNKVKEDYYCMLDLGRNAARFSDYTVFRADSAVLAPTADPAMRDKLIFDLGKQNYRFYGDVIQGFPSGQLTYTDLVTPDYLEYNEPLGSMEWEIGEDTDTICGYVCTKATTSYGGREWNAWFAEEIPSQFGPWKFNGLPGLILRVTDTEGVHDFSAISFKKGTTPVAKPKNDLIAKTTRDKFVDIKARFEKNPFKYIPPEAIQDVTVLRDGEVLVNGVETPKRPNGYTPIELR